MKNKFLHIVVTAVTLLSSNNLIFSQAPTLGTAANFVLFSSIGAVGNTGVSHLTGNVGTNSGAITGFGNVNGVMHTSDGATASAAADLLTAYNQLDATTPTLFPAPLLGNGDTLNAAVYSISGNTTLSDTLTLNAQGDPNAVFILQIEGTLSTNANSKIKLINGALACNVFWKVEGAVSMASGTTMRGTVIANNGAINMSSGDTLEGRALSTTGAVNVNGVLAYTPTGCGSPVLSGPAAPGLASSACYALFSGNGPVSNSGTTTVTGDIGTNVTSTTGYNPLNVTGTIHVIPDASTAQAAADLQNVYTYLNTLAPDIQLLYPAQFGNNLVLTPHTYLMNAATTFTDSLFLNAEGNANAVFVIQINGALSTSTYSKVLLINGAQSKNVYWKVDGAVSINDYSEFKGTIIANNGAISLTTGVVLEGRALTTTGALSTASITVNMPSACNLLPLSLLNFSGHIRNTDAVLNWKTTNELNTANFEIQQSMDGRNYAMVGTVAAAGTSASDRNYSFTDRNITVHGSPVIYYRLKLNDIDGKFTYSNIVPLQINLKGRMVLFYPNPVKGSATFKIFIAKEERIIYRVIDKSGTVLHTEGVNLAAGHNTINIDVKKLTAGSYILSVQGEQTKEKVLFNKQ